MIILFSFKIFRLKVSTLITEDIQLEFNDL